VDSHDDARQKPVMELPLALPLIPPELLLSGCPDYVFFCCVDGVFCFCWGGRGGGCCCCCWTACLGRRCKKVNQGCPWSCMVERRGGLDVISKLLR